MSRISICELTERQPAGRACTLLDVHRTRNPTLSEQFDTETTDA